MQLAEDTFAPLPVICVVVLPERGAILRRGIVDTIATHVGRYILSVVRNNIFVLGHALSVQTILKTKNNASSSIVSFINCDS